MIDPDTGEQVWRPAEGGPTISVDEWTGGAAGVAVPEAPAEAEATTDQGSAS